MKRIAVELRERPGRPVFVIEHDHVRSELAVQQQKVFFQAATIEHVLHPHPEALVAEAGERFHRHIREPRAGNHRHVPLLAPCIRETHDRHLARPVRRNLVRRARS